MIHHATLQGPKRQATDSNMIKSHGLTFCGTHSYAQSLAFLNRSRTWRRFYVHVCASWRSLADSRPCTYLPLSATTLPSLPCLPHQLYMVLGDPFPSNTAYSPDFGECLQPRIWKPCSQLPCWFYLQTDGFLFRRKKGWGQPGGGGGGEI